MALSAWLRRKLLLTPLLLASCCLPKVVEVPHTSTSAPLAEQPTPHDYSWVGLAAQGACFLFAAYQAKGRRRGDRKTKAT